MFASTGYGTGAALLKISRNENFEESSEEDAEDLWQAEEVYFLEADTMQNHHGGLILHEGIVYTGFRAQQGISVGVEDGEWRGRVGTHPQ